METVGAREFVRNFKEWRGVDCVVVGRNWRRLWLSDNSLMSDKKGGILGEGMSDNGDICQTSEEITGVGGMSDKMSDMVKCELCGDIAGYEVWEEGEEKAVCKGCLVRSVPPKMVAGVLRKSKKINV